MKISNTISTLVASGVCLGQVYAQNLELNDSKITTFNTNIAHLVRGVQINVNNIQLPTNRIGIPSPEYLHAQMNRSTIDDQINRDLQRQRGELVRSSGGIIKTTDDGKSFAFGGFPPNLDTTISQNGDITIKYTIKF